MDAALLLIAGNEPCPQPQTSEHLAAVEIMKLEQIIMEVDHNKDGELQFGEFCLFIKKIKEGGIHGGGYQEGDSCEYSIDSLAAASGGTAKRCTE